MTLQRGVAIGLQAVLGVCAAGLLGWATLRVNLDRMCVVDDTPYLNLCARPAPGSAAHLDRLRSRVAANPGDTPAYIHLAFYDRSAEGATWIRLASQLAPGEVNVLTLQAATALAQQAWPQAVAPLVQLVQYRASDDASVVLARLIGMGHAPLLAEHLTPGSRWLQRVLAQLPGAKVPVSAAMPLVLQAVEKGALEPSSITPYIRQLKTASAWVDAYGLWMSLHRNQVPVLFNGGFDQPFTADGFDWEPGEQAPAGKAGAALARTSDGPGRDGVLQVRFTGRRFSLPLVRQYLFLGEGRYRLTGEHRGSRLRMAQGLAWVVRCTGSTAVAGHSEGLMDTGGAWKSFSLEFSIPPGCGHVVSLQLETHAAYEAETGASGRVEFDAFSLQKQVDP
ncbi:MAG TPA: hypothetical protein VLI46_12710 [Ramlibacter sp.]|nr:hypothetical protein [Ramlibacter sp.]